MEHTTRIQATLSSCSTVVTDVCGLRVFHPVFLRAPAKFDALTMYAHSSFRIQAQLLDLRSPLLVQSRFDFFSSVY